MEYISFRTDKNVLRQIEKGMKEFHYSTKSDFLRDAVRTKLQMLEENRAKKKAWQALYSARGIFKGQGKAKTEEEWHKWRMEYGEKLAEELAKKYDLKI
ncbi:MAG: ribbon-helix-helix domain-containing protein [Candidatus Diapherotrites archaeon]